MKINKFISLKGLLDYLVQHKIITLEVKMCFYNTASIRGHIQLHKANLEVQKETTENHLKS